MLTQAHRTVGAAALLALMFAGGSNRATPAAGQGAARSAVRLDEVDRANAVYYRDTPEPVVTRQQRRRTAWLRAKAAARRAADAARSAQLDAWRAERELAADRRARFGEPATMGTGR